jgi:Uma2 family endonuclease
MSHEPSTASLAATAFEPPSLLDIRHRITVAEYHRMAKAEIFGPEARIELIEGLLVQKVLKTPVHAVTTDLIGALFHRLLVPGFFITRATPLTIEERDSEPEPDAMVIRGAIRDYANRPRTPADAALVIEVADTSYRTDRFTKYAIYAAAKVPIYWIVDLNRSRLELHTEPRGEGETAHYAQTRLLDPTDEVPLVLDGREVARFAVRDILP